MDDVEAVLIDDARADVWDVAGTELRHAEIEDRAERVSRRHDLGIMDSEGPLRRADPHRPRFIQREIEQEMAIGRTAAPIAMAVPTVDVQIGASPQVDV